MKKILFFIGAAGWFCAAAFAAGANSQTAEDHTIYAQRLIDEMAGRHPELNILSFHATPRGETESRIIASSSKSKVGKKSDPDDLDAMKEPKAELRDDKKIVDIGLPLKDGPGNVIGTMVAEVKYSFTNDPGIALKRATEIRDELAKQIGSHRHLFAEYYPVTRQAPYAQQLIEETITKHPEILHLSIHAVPPGESGTYRTIATNLPFRMGRKDDPDDLDALKAPDIHFIENNKMVVCALAMEDSGGRVVGILVIQVSYSFTKDKAAVLRYGEKIRDELKARVNSLEQLFESVK